jgi:glucose dehydrogenase
MRIAAALLLVILVTALASAQGVVAPAALVRPATDSWPMYNGDYSGRRFSQLTTVNSSNVQSLSLGWTHRIAAEGPAGGGGSTSAVIKGTPSSTACCT